MEMYYIWFVHMPGCERWFLGDHIVDDSHDVSIMNNKRWPVGFSEEPSFNMGLQLQFLDEHFLLTLHWWVDFDWKRSWS